MSFKDAQGRVDRWFVENKAEYWKPLEMLARLTEETGEVARELNHRFGPKKKKAEEETQEIGDELGDILVTVVCMANALHINLDESFDRVMKKVYERDTARFGNR